MARFVEVFLHEIIDLAGDDDEELHTFPFSYPFSSFWSEIRASRHPLWSFSPVCCQQLKTWHVCVSLKPAVMPVTGGGVHSVLSISKPELRALLCEGDWLSMVGVTVGNGQVSRLGLHPPYSASDGVCKSTTNPAAANPKRSSFGPCLYHLYLLEYKIL